MALIKLGTETKTPAGVKRRSINWTVHMEAGDAIDTISYDSPVDMPIVDEGINGLLTTFVVSGGILGWTHTVRASITTMNGETLEGDIAFVICP